MRLPHFYKYLIQFEQSQLCTCVCTAPAWPQLQSGGAGSEAEEAGGDVSVGGVPWKQVSLCLHVCTQRKAQF